MNRLQIEYNNIKTHINNGKEYGYWNMFKQYIRYQKWKLKSVILRKIIGKTPIYKGKIYCEICKEYLGDRYDYSLLDSGEACSKSMGDYYSRRQHYEDKHNMNTDEARSYSL